jgi:hypothetical protein
LSKTIDEKKSRDLFLQGAALDKEYMSPHELELFELETKMRKVLLELLKPVLEDMDEDRRNVRSVQINS